MRLYFFLLSLAFFNVLFPLWTPEGHNYAIRSFVLFPPHFPLWTAGKMVVNFSATFEVAVYWVIGAVLFVVTFDISAKKINAYPLLLTIANAVLLAVIVFCVLSNPDWSELHSLLKERSEMDKIQIAAEASAVTALIITAGFVWGFYRWNARTFFLIQALRVKCGLHFGICGLNVADLDDAKKLHSFAWSQLLPYRLRSLLPIGGETEARLLSTLPGIDAGEGVGEDARVAFLCFSRSAQLGYPPAQFALSEIYRGGFTQKDENAENVPLLRHNETLSKKWLIIAANGGHPPAEARLAETVIKPALTHGE